MFCGKRKIDNFTAIYHKTDKDDNIKLNERGERNEKSVVWLILEILEYSEKNIKIDNLPQT